MELRDLSLPFELEFAATPEDIRRALERMRLALCRAGIGGAQRSRAELVLAEVLNNIAEHAYAGRTAGRVWLRVGAEAGELRAVIRDRGRPMPPGGVPRGTRPETDVSRDALPEGGFGWYLIHAQVDSLNYRRKGGENHLGLCFASGFGG